MRPITFIIISVLLLSFRVEAGDVDHLLQQMINAPKNQNFVASYVYVHDGTVDTMRLAHMSNNGKSRLRLSHLNGANREIFQDGERTIGILADGKPVIIDKAKIPSPLNSNLIESLRHISALYQFKILGYDRIAGRLTQVLEAKSLDGYRFSYRFWIDNQTFMPLRSDVVDIDGKVIEQFMAVSFEVVSDLPESLLVMPVVKNQQAKEPVSTESQEVEVNAKKLWQVQWIPTGFELKNTQNKKANNLISHLVYHDGFSTISIYIESKPLVKQQVDRVTVMRQGGITMYDEAFRDFHVTIIGEIPTRTAERIARSVATN
jgi:sigma-E factor negative regulatory protein RseB